MNPLIKKCLCVGLILSLAISVTGCEELNSIISRMKGQLVGNAFNISLYDNNANNTLNLSGKKVDIEEVTDDIGNESSYVDITIDGEQLLSVGSTIIFEENSLEPVTDFKISDYIGNADSSTGVLPADRLINDIKNSIGDKKTVVIESQLGVPIAVYQGDSVNMSVPSDLPKTTLLSIDGKALYIHRANCVIVSTELIE